MIDNDRVTAKCLDFGIQLNVHVFGGRLSGSRTYMRADMVCTIVRLSVGAGTFGTELSFAVTGRT